MLASLFSLGWTGAMGALICATAICIFLAKACSFFHFRFLLCWLGLGPLSGGWGGVGLRLLLLSPVPWCVFSCRLALVSSVSRVASPGLVRLLSGDLGYVVGESAGGVLVWVLGGVACVAGGMVGRISILAVSGVVVGVVLLVVSLRASLLMRSQVCLLLRFVYPLFCSRRIGFASRPFPSFFCMTD